MVALTKKVVEKEEVYILRETDEFSLIGSTFLRDIDVEVSKS